jgi:hypothetical protein
MIKRWAYFSLGIAETSSVIKASARSSCVVSCSQSVMSRSESRRSRAAFGALSCGEPGSLSASAGVLAAGMVGSRGPHTQTHRTSQFRRNQPRPRPRHERATPGAVSRARIPFLHGGSNANLRLLCCRSAAAAGPKGRNRTKDHRHPIMRETGAPPWCCGRGGRAASFRHGSPTCRGV